MDRRNSFTGLNDTACTSFVFYGASQSPHSDIRVMKHFWTVNVKGIFSTTMLVGV